MYLNHITTRKKITILTNGTEMLNVYRKLHKLMEKIPIQQTK